MHYHPPPLIPLPPQALWDVFHGWRQAADDSRAKASMYEQAAARWANLQLGRAWNTWREHTLHMRLARQVRDGQAGCRTPSV